LAIDGFSPPGKQNPEERPGAMKVEFINPFLGATMRVLRTLAAVEARPGKPFVKKEGGAQGDVSGIIGITGPVNGSMSLSFSGACILRIMAGMLGEEVEKKAEITKDIKDAVGELTNMICGDARNELGQHGYQFQIALPTVITGLNHEIQHKCKAPTIAIPFDTDAGSFVVEVSFEK
jgi:chemotaxis protein CheX